MAIPENIINEIRERADIVEIIDSYIHLKKTGRNFKALCPFHPEKTSSFVVSPEKQIFHCFGCGEGGNVIHFLMRYQNTSFVEAVKQLASMLGVEIPEQETNTDSKRLLDLNKIASDFYFKQLFSKAGSKCMQYLKSRGISEETIENFQLGYAADSWDSLSQYLISKGYNYEFLQKAGLSAKAREAKKYFDIFRDRLMFPIFDHRGKVLGFGARVLSEVMPKYLNSPETIAYKKGKILYGVNVTLTQIKKERVAIIVEGYLDMISLYQAGIENVVASLGTALTQDQVRFLKKYTDEIIIIYDGDKSGQIASLRSLDIVFSSGIKAKAVGLPLGYDPDSFIKKIGKIEFLKLIFERKEIFDYKLDTLISIYGKDSLDSRIKIVNEMFLSLNEMEDYLLKSEYMKKLSNKLGFDEKVLWEQFNVKVKRSSEPKMDSRTIARNKNYTPVEATLVYIMLDRKELIPELKNILSPQEFLTPQIQSIVEKIYALYPDNEKLKLGNFMNLIPDDEAKILSEIMAEDLEFQDDIFDKYLTECITNIKIMRIKMYCKFLEEEIKKAQAASDINKLGVLFKELSEIKKKEIEI